MTTARSIKGEHDGKPLDESGFRLQRWYTVDPTKVTTRSERDNEEYVEQVDIQQYLEHYLETHGYV